MSIFDKLKSTAQQAVNTATKSIGSKRETFTFTSLPESLAEMQALPEASLDTPFKTAALTVLALCAYLLPHLPRTLPVLPEIKTGSQMMPICCPPARRWHCGKSLRKFASVRRWISSS